MRPRHGFKPSIPIVMHAVSDPVGMGSVASLARPGGNIAGVTSAIPEGFLAKQLQLIKEAIPTAARVRCYSMRRTR